MTIAIIIIINILNANSYSAPGIPAILTPSKPVKKPKGKKIAAITDNI